MTDKNHGIINFYSLYHNSGHLYVGCTLIIVHPQCTLITDSPKNGTVCRSFYNKIRGKN